MSTSAAPPEDRWRPDLPTLVAIAVVAYALANVAHEGIGHGGACVLEGSRPLALTSIAFECDEPSLSAAGRRVLAGGGTLANVLLAAAAVWGSKASRLGPRFRFFFWLLATLNLFQAAGYFLFSGIGDVGDWSEVIRGFQPAIAWRVGLTAFGALAYMAVAAAAALWLAPLLGGEGRIARARRLAVPSYLAGGVLYCASGLFNPVGPLLLFISAAAASFGGASGFLWFYAWLNSERIPMSSAPIDLQRSNGWLAVGALTAILFVFVLGPGVRF